MNNFKLGFLMGYVSKQAADITVGVPPKLGATPEDDDDVNTPVIPAPMTTDGDRSTGPGGTGMINSGTL